jgi:hypothetical protein
LAQIILRGRGFTFFSKEGDCPSPRGDDSERVKMRDLGGKMSENLGNSLESYNVEVLGNTEKLSKFVCG